MASIRDPVEFAADEDRDLQGIATWEPRSLLDRLLVFTVSTSITVPLGAVVDAVRGTREKATPHPESTLGAQLVSFAAIAFRVSIVLLGLLIFFGVSILLLVQVVFSPQSLLFVVLFPISVIPALILTGYVWYTDITSEPVLPLVATYLLGIVLASFPFLVNTLVQVLVIGLLLRPVMDVPILNFLVQAANFYLVVAPVEEVAKLSAVAVFVYWTDDFDTVIDGAVYGAIAGLGFATIENISYIISTLAGTSTIGGVIVTGGLITAVRSIAGPGHVIWTGIAGYYLGLAKFNRDYSLPLVVKGLLIAAVLHGTYNTVATGLGPLASAFGLGVLGVVGSFGFIFVYHTTFFGYLFVRIRRYRKTYADVSPGDHAAEVSTLDGYEEMVEGADETGDDGTEAAAADGWERPDEDDGESER